MITDVGAENKSVEGEKFTLEDPSMRSETGRQCLSMKCQWKGCATSCPKLL